VRMRGRTSLVAAIATCAFAASSAAARRAPPAFTCAEKQIPRRSCFSSYDESGGHTRLCGVSNVNSFAGTLRLPMKDLGPYFRHLGTNAPFRLTLGNLSFDGTLAQSNYKSGRASARFVLVGGGGGDPFGGGVDVGGSAPPVATAKLVWTRTRLTVSIVAHDTVLLPDPEPTSYAIDDTRPMSFTFAATHADLDVRLAGAVNVRPGDDGFGDLLPITSVRIRGTGVVK